MSEYSGVKVKAIGLNRRNGPLGRWNWYLLIVFLVTTPFVNPWIRGDGVGYYAYARALLIEHRLDFAPDWKHANESFVMGREDASGRILPDQYTPTGHLINHFSIGPALLWLPFLFVTHGAVTVCDALGAHIPANGFSRPYVATMALTTALYGFLGLWISFQIARRYVAERWAFLATVAIWAATSLPVYMYFNPSWSHAQSAFVLALFLWYWDKTRECRSLRQWVILGLMAGLAMDVYYVNAIVLLFPGLESVDQYRLSLASRHKRDISLLFFGDALFIGAASIAFSPTLIAKKIIYGSYLNFGYAERWSWNSPAFFRVAVSSDHGLFSWTPILVLSVIGFFFLVKRDRVLGLYSLASFVVFWYVIGCYQNWDGLSSFGNRFFVSLTPIFILGLAALFDRLARIWNSRRTFAVASASTALLILWNLGMMYQWGMHLVPVRGPISWREAVYNQFAVVPSHAARDLGRYFLRRGKLMQHIENVDVRQLKARSK
jgi:Dolichyl-phosphate-mannose-protein mannosyltransferase